MMAWFKERILAPPKLVIPKQGRPDDWTTLPLPAQPKIGAAIPAPETQDDDPTESERRRQPELSRAQPVEKATPIENEFEIDTDRDDEMDDAAPRNSRMTQIMQGVARQVSLDPGDGMEM
jgi:type IV secretion system protein VirD4